MVAIGHAFQGLVFACDAARSKAAQLQTMPKLIFVVAQHFTSMVRIAKTLLTLFVHSTTRGFAFEQLPTSWCKFVKGREREWKDVFASLSTRGELPWIDGGTIADLGVQLLLFMIDDQWSQITRLKRMIHFIKKMFVHSLSVLKSSLFL